MPAVSDSSSVIGLQSAAHTVIGVADTPPREARLSELPSFLRRTALFLLVTPDSHLKNPTVSPRTVCTSSAVPGAVWFGEVPRVIRVLSCSVRELAGSVQGYTLSGVSGFLSLAITTGFVRGT